MELPTNPAHPPGDPKQFAVAPEVEGTIPEPSYPQWRQAGRANRWSPLPVLGTLNFWITQTIATLALILLVRFLVQWGMGSINQVLIGLSNSFATLNRVLFLKGSLRFPYLPPIQGLYQDPWVGVVVGLGILFCLSPWLLTAFLKLGYGLEPLAIGELNAYSPEAVRLLNRVSHQRNWPTPVLGILPVTAPVIFSYGCLPRFAHIVVSQGCLTQLSEEELATLYGAELSQISSRTFMASSWMALILQIPYFLYWQLAHWGDRQRYAILRNGAAGLSALCYGLYWVLRLPMLEVSRLRITLSDRRAVNLTGNPNALARSLLKVTIGIAQDIQTQGRVSYLLEGLAILMPIGYAQALSLGSGLVQVPTESLLTWDLRNPYRSWLLLNNTHPLLGERLRTLMQWASQGRLDLELDLASPSNDRPDYSSRRWWQLLLLQAAPYLAPALGLLVVLLLWLVGAISDVLNIWVLEWMAGDRDLFIGGLTLACGVGIIARINTFFPDLQPSLLQTDPYLPGLWADPRSIPLDSIPVRLQGTLLGRRGISNWLCQDLTLQTPTGLIKLHYCSPLGPVGNLIFGSARMDPYLGKAITLTGWLRRGATPWLDVETLRGQRQRPLNSYHPIWSTGLAGGLIGLGVLILY